MEARRDCSCRSKYLFKQHGAKAGGARSSILSFSRAGQIFSTPLGGSPVNRRGSGADSPCQGEMSRRDRGGRDRRHKNTECFSRRRPPVAFCLLCRRGQSRSPRRAKPSTSPIPPAGEIPTCPFVVRQSGQSARATPTGAANRPGCRAGTDGRIISAPTQKKKTARNGRPQAAPTQNKEKPEGEEGGSISPLPSLRAQRRSEASQKVLCQAFFQESGGGLEFF